MKKEQPGKSRGKKQDGTGKHDVFPYGNGKNCMIGNESIKSRDKITNIVFNAQL